VATEERPERPTPRKRRRAREQGQVATSTDLSSAIALLLIYLAWRLAGPAMVQRMADATERWLTVPEPPHLTPESVADGLQSLLLLLGAVLAPVMLAAIIGSVAATAAQTRGLISSALLQPDVGRINPANGFKRLFSVRGLVATLKGIIKVCVVMLIAALILRARAPEIIAMGDMELLPMVSTMLAIAGEMVVKCTLTLLVLGGADYAFEWWDHEKSLRMTRQELKRELREDDGDPQMQQRRRQMRRDILAQGISGEMPHADVVVTNPTQYAVALRYDPREMAAPRVVAKGQRAVARQIRRLAQQWGIEIVENPPVARSLFAACRLGDPVPEALYTVVAEIFAAVYRRRQARRDRTFPGS